MIVSVEQWTHYIIGISLLIRGVLGELRLGD